MREIIELDDMLSNKIAAGEVVERPASVVKELVENAVDAGSTIVEINIKEAGLGEIRIIDNGKGIGEEDILSAFKRHATSKIKDEHDLFRIRTLGFRGEALPSIASVSRLTMVTAKEGKDGTKVVLEGGKIVSHEKAPARKGTDITVSDLFFNTPARLKYVKTLHTEIGHITDVVNRLALAHPDVSIRLSHDGRILLHTNGSGDIRQVLAAIYGKNVARDMIEISGKSLDFSVSGFIARPEVTRASRSYLSTMINGRFIKNYSLVKAVLEGYHTLLPIGRFPIALLSVDMDPILVDVNVHPAKLEVRLSKEQELKEFITETIKQAFKKEQLIPSGVIPAPKKKNVSFQPEFRLEPAEEKMHPKTEWRRQPAAPFNKKEKLLPAKEMKRLYDPVEYEPSAPHVSKTNELNVQSFDREEAVQNVQVEVQPEAGQETERFPALYPIGQMHGTYIFAQNELGLYMIDQHAAQERIKYEYFREKVGKVENDLQQLLVPLTLEFSVDEYVKIKEHTNELEDVGIFLEEFGMNSFIVRSHPTWFPKGQEQMIIEGMIEQLLSMNKIDIKKLREEAAIMMSCKAAIKANRYLRSDEIQALLDELRRTEDPFTCPHGRPIIVHFSITDMEKMFKRIM
ncbi:DNA mismatch repair endonuclease MutL [Siminovitchia acidinfaciens]|uniref:DNA mismatch repair protein MutL n=1 Tax=Siminovitchia acidinfaciens TaxID=2321395 RepID=A0A429Y2U0_9BACI|nr:DNA mismatch repair endonuclease MutL [Siminovitchia acidinfaciens]RST75555.1 DNA mismatch repair endonuclease MutL [Siminovitchia acidinfaciens]